MGLILLGAFNPGIPFLLITWGQQFIDSSVAGILNATVPLFTMVIAHFALRDEPITRRRVLGLMVGFVGVILIFSDEFPGGRFGSLGLFDDPGRFKGQLAVLLAATCYAATAVLVRRTMRHVAPLVIAAGTQSVAFAFVSVSAFLLEAPMALVPRISSESWFALGWLGLLVTCLGGIVHFAIIHEWGATRATLVTYVIPVVAFGLGATVLGEDLSWRQLAGALLILGGIALVNRIPEKPQ
jgi:drug/metabolite transporter (DMT)-like permease